MCSQFTKLVSLRFCSCFRTFLCRVHSLYVKSMEGRDISRNSSGKRCTQVENDVRRRTQGKCVIWNSNPDASFSFLHSCAFCCCSYDCEHISYTFNFRSLSLRFSSAREHWVSTNDVNYMPIFCSLGIPLLVFTRNSHTTRTNVYMWTVDVVWMMHTNLS